MSTFGQFLKELRLEFDFGLRSFSEAIGIDAGNLSRTERGKLKPPKDQAFFQEVANVLGLEIDDPRIQKLQGLALEERLQGMPASWGAVGHTTDAVFARPPAVILGLGPLRTIPDTILRALGSEPNPSAASRRYSPFSVTTCGNRQLFL